MLSSAFLLFLDENLFHISYEAGILEDPNTTPPEDMWKLTSSAAKAPDSPEHITLKFAKGIPTSLQVGSTGKTHTESVDLFLTLNALARTHGVGRVDIVENRFIGVKSRGCYETPAGTILRAAHVDLEGLTLDREVRRARDQLITTKLSEILYYGFFFSPESEFIRKCIPHSQETVNGEVRLKLYKGALQVEGRKSDEVSRKLRPFKCHVFGSRSTIDIVSLLPFFCVFQMLYDEKFSSMDELGGFEPEATSGFIAVQAIRLKRHGLGLVEKGRGGVGRDEAYKFA